MLAGKLPSVYNENMIYQIFIKKLLGLKQGKHYRKKKDFTTQFSSRYCQVNYVKKHFENKSLICRTAKHSFNPYPSSYFISQIPKSLNIAQ